MKNRSILLITSVVLSLSLGVFYACEIGAKDGIITQPKMPNLTNQEAIEKRLTIQVMDRTYQWNGKVEVAYTNICSQHEFRLTKYEKGKKIEYFTRSTPLYISASGTETLELSIPHLITPRAAIVLVNQVVSSACQCFHNPISYSPNVLWLA